MKFKKGQLVYAEWVISTLKEEIEDLTIAYEEEEDPKIAKRLMRKINDKSAKLTQQEAWAEKLRNDFGM